MLNTNQLSYWERETYFNNIDFLVVGAGIVGYSCALELKKNNPSASIIILERGFLPTGASSKNAGFACFGSPTELVDDLSHIHEEDVWNTVAMRWEGLKNLKSLIGLEHLDLQVNGSWDLIKKQEGSIYSDTVGKLDYLNKKTAEITGISEVYSIDKNVSYTFGFQGVTTSSSNKLEGQINTGKMNQLVIEKGIKCLFGIEVTSINPFEKTVHLETSFGEMKASKVAVCTNGFAEKFLPNKDVQPARAQAIGVELWVLVPLKNRL